MSLEFGLYQGPNLSQQLNLAPQLLQWLRLLQAPTLELETFIRHELETNPALEMDESHPKEREDDAGDEEEIERQPTDAAPLTLDDHEVDSKLQYLAEIDSDWRAEYFQMNDQYRSSSAEAQEKHQFILDSLVAPRSLHEHLANQIRSLSLSDNDRTIAHLIIGSLDARGYLTASSEELAEMAGTSAPHIEEVLVQVRTLDPAGVAARDLRECLLLQLHETNPKHALAIRILRDHSDLLSAQLLSELARVTHTTEDGVRKAMAVIRALQPEPGRLFSASPVQHITPDVTVRKINGQYTVELNNEQLPRLRLSESCRRLLEEKTATSEDMAYLRRKMRSAAFIIHGIGQRQDTLKKVSGEIVRVQQKFLDEGQGELVPLTMANIAARIGVHETTVSRALANKYIETPHGVFEMRYFFRSGYACADGSALTPERVKELIAELIDRENPVVPLTDLQLAQALQKRGLKVARRTIAKYREETNYPSSKERTRRSPLREETRHPTIIRTPTTPIHAPPQPEPLEIAVCTA
jgi:RNA polymerase sigma-54 factor